MLVFEFNPAHWQLGDALLPNNYPLPTCVAAETLPVLTLAFNGQVGSPGESTERCCGIMQAIE